MLASKPSRGEVWLVDPEPVRGREQGGVRPALVVSVDTFNHGPAGLLFTVPFTSRDKGVRSHVRVAPPEGGLTVMSWAKCEDLRSISAERLIRRLGTVTPVTLQEVERRLRFLLGL